MPWDLRKQKLKRPGSCLANCQAPSPFSSASALKGRPVPRGNRAPGLCLGPRTQDPLGPVSCEATNFGSLVIAQPVHQPLYFEWLLTGQLCSLTLEVFSVFAFSAGEAGSFPTKELASYLVQL